MSVASRDFEYLRALVHERSAIVLEPGKEYLVEARLEPLARSEGLDSITALVARLRSNPSSSLRDKIVEAMTTNETSFFRDHAPFEYLRRELLPELIKRRGAERVLRIWCAASSTGQEPYSIAMIIHEHFPELLGWSVQMIASDLSKQVLERARSGIYNQAEIKRGLPAVRLSKYFERQGRHWQLGSEIRQMVDFRRINLIGIWPSLPPMDIIFCRNVLIYFDAETKKKILTKLRSVLAHDGYLLLGSAETTLSADESFQRVQFDGGCCYRIEEP